LTLLNLISVFVFAIFFLSCFTIYKNALSPEKLFFSNLGLFFGALFFDEISLKIHCLFYTICFAAFIGAVTAKSFSQNYNKVNISFKEILPPGPILKIWLISVPAIVAQIYLILRFGSFGDYVKAVTISEIEFRGLGPLIWLIKTFPICNVVYFCILCVKNKINKLNTIGYSIHFLIMILISLLSGSRGTLLVPIFLLFFCYHYLVKKIKLSKLIFIAFFLILCALILGVAREGYNVIDGKLTTGLSEKTFAESFKIAAFYVGIQSLELVLENKNKLYWGVTYLSAVTNFVPRAIWPDKPPTGGMVLTRDYTGDAWQGLSYLSTGIIPEAVINFGSIGIGIGIGITFFINAYLGRQFLQISKTITQLPKLKKIKTIVIYGFVSWGLCALLVGDFANIVTTTILNIFIAPAIIWVIQINLKFKIK